MTSLLSSLFTFLGWTVIVSWGLGLLAIIAVVAVVIALLLSALRFHAKAAR